MLVFGHKCKGCNSGYNLVRVAPIVTRSTLEDWMRREGKKRTKGSTTGIM
jgi:hypothetical protein